jgi:hypothetical protein
MSLPLLLSQEQGKRFRLGEVVPGCRFNNRRGAGQSEGVVEFAVGEESGVAGDGRAVELQLDLAVEVNAQGSWWLSPIGFLGRFGRKESETLGFPGKRRKRHAETIELSGKSGLSSTSPILLGC